MMIFKNMSIAVSTSIICASLFFGDVEAFNEYTFNRIVTLNKIKGTRSGAGADKYAASVKEALKTSVQCYSKIAKTYKNLKQKHGLGKYISKSDKNNDINNAISVISYCADDELFIDIVNELMSDEIRQYIFEEQSNLLTDRQRIILTFLTSDTHTWYEALNICEHNAVKKTIEQIKHNADLVEKLKKVKGNIKNPKDVEDQQDQKVISKWEHFCSEQREHVDNVLSICYDTCGGDPDKVIKLFLGDYNIKINEDLTKYDIVNNDNFKTTKANIVKNVRDAFISHIAKHFLRYRDLDQKEYDEFNLENFFPTGNDKLKTHGFCYITNGDFCDNDKYIAVSNLLTNFVNVNNFNNITYTVDGTQEQKEAHYIFKIDTKDGFIRIKPEETSEKIHFTMNSKDFFGDGVNFKTYKTTGKIGGTNENIQALISDFKDDKGISKEEYDALTVENTTKNILPLFFWLTINFNNIHKDHVGSLFVVS